MKIWTLKDSDDVLDYSIDDIVEEYYDYVTNPYSRYRQTSEWRMNDCRPNMPKTPPKERALKYDTTWTAKMIYGEDHPPIKIDKLHTPNKENVKTHFIALIHQLYLRKINSKTGKIRLNTQILKKVNGNYNWMLKTLCHTSVLFPQSHSVGTYAIKTYHIIPRNKFEYIDNDNVKVIKHTNKYKAELEKLHKKDIEKAKEKTSSQFIEKYNKAVRSFKLPKLEEAQKKVLNTELSKDARDYYLNIISKISEGRIKEIDKADDNGRIYHIVTQTPRVLRKYTNISNIVDAKNSHPVLFNFYILEYYFNKDNININNKVYKTINTTCYKYLNKYLKEYENINKNNSNKIILYLAERLRKDLASNGIKKEQFAILKNIPKDVWKYLHSTANGTLWDEINIEFPDYDRDYTKRTMFKEVFYSYSYNVKKDKLFAKVFKTKYPNVYKIIKHYKKTYQAQCKEENIGKQENEMVKILLAHKLMQLESFIFTEILTRLHRNRKFKGVCIHDAIAIFDNTIEPKEVEKIMNRVYEDIGLYPTFSTGDYNSDCGTIYEDDEIEGNLEFEENQEDDEIDELDD